MKICMISPSYFPIIGGTEVAIHEISTRLIERGFEVTILTPLYPDYSKARRFESAHGVKICRFKISKIAYRFNTLTRYADIQMRCFKRLLELFRWNNFDLIHQFHLFALGGAVVLAKKKLGIPLITTLIGWDTYNPLKTVPRALYPYNGWVMNSSEKVIATSNHLTRYANQQGYTEEPTVIPLGVSPERFHPGVDSLKVRKQLELDDEDILVLSVSRLVPTKGIGYLIKSVPRVKFRKSNIKFVIVGEGPEMKKLKKLMKELEITNTVYFAGHVSHKYLPLYYSACDIFVFPSLSEAFGIVAIEAMASGKPIIATNTGALPTLIEDRKNGFLVPLRDPRALADAILRLANQKRLRQQMGKEGREKAKKEYDWDVIVERYIKEYNNIT